MVTAKPHRTLHQPPEPDPHLLAAGLAILAILALAGLALLLVVGR